MEREHGVEEVIQLGHEFLQTFHLVLQRLEGAHVLLGEVHIAHSQLEVLLECALDLRMHSFDFAQFLVVEGVDGVLHGISPLHQVVALPHVELVVVLVPKGSVQAVQPHLQVIQLVLDGLTVCVLLHIKLLLRVEC